ncbi:hypothetical protein F183_A26470 [Bryobacterales bacterium F-183]|nr:hypothetical protein F183_A26470 [Bryobacterales bacterium F-183]
MYSLLIALVLVQQDPKPVSTNPEIQRLEELVAAGAIAPLRLVEARQNLADSEDAAILSRTMYARITPEEFTAEQAAAMTAAAKRRLDRQQEKIDRMQKLVDSGVSAKSDLEPLQAELEARLSVFRLAESRAALLAELAEMAQAEQAAAATIVMTPSTVDGTGPMVEHFAGVGKFNDADLKRVVLAFEKEFARPLPVSAKGETAVHRSLGFDHRGRIDVGVNPDSGEGQWIRKFLALNKIPYIAFRRAIQGQATAPHIHIGPPSPRLAPTTTTD